MTSIQRGLQAHVNALLVNCGLATAEKNSGFYCFFQSGAERPDPFDGILRVELAAHRRVYPVIDSYSISPFFWVDSADSEAEKLDPWVVRVLLPSKQPDLQRVRASAVWKKLKLPTPLVNMEPVIVALAQTLDWRLKTWSLAQTLDNRISLANIHFAYSANRLMHREQVDEGVGPIDWLRAGVNIDKILYAWSADGWDYSRGEPALPLAAAIDLKDVPLSRVRALYPQISGRDSGA